MNAYDIETFLNDKFEHIPYCICYIIKNKEYSIYYEESSDIIIDSIINMFSITKTRETVIYVHNLNFDGLLIINSLSNQNKIKFNTFMRDLRIYNIAVKFNNKIINFRCSYKILPSSLKNISKSFNLEEKMVFPYKFSSLENLFYEGPVPIEIFFNTFEEWEFLNKNLKKFNFREYSILYCTRDVVITSKFVKILFNLVSDLKINFNSIYSAPSLSFKIFLKNFNFNSVNFDYNNKLDKILRQSYYGGRCEVYGNPYDEEFIFHFDFAGMYAQCMLEEFPYGKYKIVKNLKKIEKPGFYFIEFYSNMNIPVLPHHRWNDKKLMFTNGTISGCYWFEEIKLFLNQGGTLKRIKYAVIFENYGRIFEKFIEYFKKIRELGNDYKTFSKIVVNSLYGRMGMGEIDNYSFFIKKENLKDCYANIDINSIKPLNNIILVDAVINYKLKRYLKMEFKNPKNNIALASAITSKARIKLYKAQKDVEENKGRILYSDTDSIFAAFKKNVGNEKHGDILWDISKNDTVIKKAVFVNPKTYALIYENDKNIVKMKGYNQKDLDYKTIEETFYNEEKIVIRNYLTIRKKELNLTNELTEKIFDLSQYDKRKFTKDKKDTMPYTYQNFKYV